MDFGIALATSADSWKVVARAEELGFTNAWFYDTQMLSADCFVAMGAAAVKTQKIRLGTGVLIPSNRIAPVAANALASLNQLAPGRVDFGIGTGFTGRRAMGLGALKLAEMEDYITVVYSLLAGQTIERDFDGKLRKIRFLNPDAGLINTAATDELYVGTLTIVDPATASDTNSFAADVSNDDTIDLYDLNIKELLDNWMSNRKEGTKIYIKIF